MKCASALPERTGIMGKKFKTFISCTKEDNMKLLAFVIVLNFLPITPVLSGIVEAHSTYWHMNIFKDMINTLPVLSIMLHKL